MNTYGSRLRAAREKSGTSLRGMAKFLGFSAAHLSDVELDRRTFSDDREKAVCVFLGITPGDLGERPSDVLRRLKPRLQDPAFLARLSEFLNTEVD